MSDNSLITDKKIEHSYSFGTVVDIAEEDFSRVEKLLAGIPGGAYKAVGNALTRAANSAKTVAKKSVTQEYTISSSNFLEETRNVNHINRKSDGVISVSFGYRGHVINLLKFDTKVDKNGAVSTHVMRSTTRDALHHAFLAKMGSHTGIYERITGARFPVLEKYGPATPQMMYSNEAVTDAIEEKAAEVYEQRIEHEITRILNGWGN